MVPTTAMRSAARIVGENAGVLLGFWDAMGAMIVLWPLVG